MADEIFFGGVAALKNLPIFTTKISSRKFRGKIEKKLRCKTLAAEINIPNTTLFQKIILTFWIIFRKIRVIFWISLKQLWDGKIV